MGIKHSIPMNEVQVKVKKVCIHYYLVVVIIDDIIVHQYITVKVADCSFLRL